MNDWTRRWSIGACLALLLILGGRPLCGQGLVAAYDFDEAGGNEVLDVSGNNNNGTLEGGATRHRNGVFNSAAEFNGSSTFVNLGGLVVVGQKFTCTAWIRADDFGTGDARIISKAVGTANADHTWMVSTIRSDGIRLRFRLETTVGGTTVLVADQATLEAGVSIHVAVTYDGARMCIYQDGVLVGSTPKTGQLVANPDVDVTIGANPVGGRHFDGLIDNLSIYERCLTHAEILIDSQTPAGQPLSPAAPTNVEATPGSATQVHIGWEDNSTDETGFAIDRSENGGGGPYQEIAVVGAGVTNFTDQNLAPAWEYCYQVRAVRDEASSAAIESSCATTDDLPLPNAGLVAAYDFEEPGGDVVLDVSGNGNNGALENGASRIANGRFGAAAEFNGTSSRVHLGGLDVAGAKLSITGWILAHDFGTGDARIISKSVGTANADHTWMVSTVRSDGIRLRFRLETTAGGTKTLIADQATLSAGVFIHFAVTYDGAQMCIYQDGVLVGNTPKTGLLVPNRNVTALIGANPVGGRYFDGLIDNLLIYARCLTPAEILIDSQTPAGQPLDPAAPSNVVATTMSDSQICVTWQNNSTDATGFQIERSDNGIGGPYAEVALVGAGVTHFTDMNLSRSAEYCYQVMTIRNGDTSTYSNSNCATTNTFPPPAAPSLLTATTTSAIEIEVAWQDNSNNETNFEVFRSDNGINGQYQHLAFVNAGVTSYCDTNLVPATPHCYQVRAVRNEDVSLFSNSDCATTDAAPIPSAPTGLSAVVNGTQVDLSWNDNSNNEDNFAIERSESGMGGPFNEIAQVSVNVTIFVDGDVVANTQYCYRVRAVHDVWGASNPSNVSCDTTGNFLENGLVLEYGFEEAGAAVTDLSGYGNDGTLQGGATRNPNGKFGAAVEFNGTSAYVDVGTLDVVGSQLTITACIRADDFGTADARIISKSSGVTNQEHEWMLSTVNSNGIRLRARLKTTNGGTTTLIGDTIIAPGVFVHVALVYDGNQMDLYQDGACVGSTAKTGQIVVNSNLNVRIGANPVEGRYFDGLIDNVRIYAEALSPADLDLDRVTPAGEPLEDTAPEAPSNLTVNAVSSSSVELAWQDNSYNEFNFQIRRSVDGGAFSLLATVASGVTSYTDETNVNPQTQYCYRVRATNAFGNSAYTASKCDSTPNVGAGPSAPTDFFVTTLAQNKVVVQWWDTSNSETGFDVQRSTSGSGGPYSSRPDAARNQEVYFDSVSSNSTYWYRVRSYNAGGQSNWVGPLQATTHATSVRQETLFDTGVFEVSETGPYYPTLNHGQNEFQTHVPLPDMDYTSPVNLTSGRVYQRMDVVNRPSLKSFCAQKQIQQTGYNGDHWWPSKPTIVEPEIYTIDHRWLSMRDATGLSERWDDPPPLRMAFAVQCAGGDPNSPYSDPDIFPMDCRFSWVLVAGGATFSGWEAIVGPDRPLFSPLGRPFITHHNPISVTMTTGTHNATIRYTTNGTTPTGSSAVYNGPIQINSTTTIKARSFKPGVPASDTTSVLYRIN